ncbi:MAG: hypothetical protein ACD_67C00055G0009 [uncultured bacterium]|nr:MAG: hypothetical protein ACD_67C00055G0009 [uncultured bacterium]
MPQAADEGVKYGKSNEEQKGSENSHVDRLAEAREAAKIAKNVAGVAAGSPGAALALSKDALSMWKQIDFMGDMPFVAAMGAAILKDVVDLGTFETIVLPVLFSMLCSIFIFMMMLLTGSNGKKKNSNVMLKKIGILLGGGVADSLISFLPIETVTVGMIYAMTLIERKSSK